MEVRSNWVVDSVVELHEAVQEAPTLPSEDVAELLDEDKCFSLTKPDEGKADEACSIRLSCAQSAPPWPQANWSAGGNKAIKAILLHSEARVVEVCVGAHDEYLKTVHGKKLGQYEDTEMCACLVELNAPRQEVLLTLKHTYNPECVWVFGLLAVTTQEYTTACSEGRFSSTHLSSVLKDKEVNMSKDAARFLHLLESYNTSNHASAQINENNQLALMSMFLGPKMLSKAHLSPGMLNMGSGGGDKDDTVRKGKVRSEEGNTPGYNVHKVDGDGGKGDRVDKDKISGEESKVDKDHSVISKFKCLESTDDNDIESRMKMLGITDKENNQANRSHELACEGKNNNNNSTSGNLYKEPVTHKKQTVSSATNQDGMIEKLFTLMGNAGQGFMRQQNTPGQHRVNKLKASSPPPLAPGLSLHRLPTSPPQSTAPQDHSSLQSTMMHTLMESLDRVPPPPPNNNFQSPHPTIPGPTHSTPRAREVGNDNGSHEDSCDGILGLEGRGVLLREVENMIDQKFAQMEERLTKRVEQKLAEKAQRDSERLEKIEEHLSRLCEQLLR